MVIMQNIDLLSYLSLQNRIYKILIFLVWSVPFVFLFKTCFKVQTSNPLSPSLSLSLSLFLTAAMESKLLEVAITGTPAHITFKSSRSTLHFVSKATFISPESNFVANGCRPIQASFSSTTSPSSSFPIRCDKNCVFLS